MALDWLPRPILVSLAILLGLFSSTSSSLSEAEALLELKKSFTKADGLSSWASGSAPCKPQAQWRGVICSNGVVSGLRLENMGLSGAINVDALANLSGLRSVSFAHNSFSGSIPELNRIGYLRAVFLTGNSFSGLIPQDFFSKMQTLKKVWLAHNNFSGMIPSSLASVPHLIELRLENNTFVGLIPFLEQPTLMSFNVSHNKLIGEIPPSVARFNTTSFEGNPGLCEDSGILCNSKLGAFFGSSAGGQSGGGHHGHTKNILIGISILLVLCLCMAAVLASKRPNGKVKDVSDDVYVKHRSEPEAVEVQVSPTKPVEMPMTKKSGSSRKGANRAPPAELVVVNDEKGMFGLPDLMKASAEVLGNGGLGSAYKATMANGLSVVVKRMREMNALGKDGFVAEIRKLASLRHSNILSPLAFHYRKDEKLLIYAFAPKGSLQFMLHGDHGPLHAELDWPNRLNIVQGIASGLEYLHAELASYDLPHGNLKSSNVLLGPDNEPLLSEYGFHRMASSLLTSSALAAYKAPEVVHVGVSRKCDVYCLGIIILEILTGKFPSQYASDAKGGTDVALWVETAVSEGKESEVLDPELVRSTTAIDPMKKLLHIGAACSESNLDRRLDLREAVRRIRDIHQNAPVQAIPPHWDGLTDAHQQAGFNDFSR